MPKFHLLYFKHLIDAALVRFFAEYNNQFTNINGKYVLSNTFGRTKLYRIFKRFIFDELSKYVIKYDRLSPNYYLLLGSCIPKNNLLLDFKKTCYFPEKLNKLLHCDYTIKYLLKETDIDIDIKRFNAMCIDIANDFFTIPNIFTKTLGNEYSNIFFIQHANLDCYVLFKTIKHIYGKTNCINIFKQNMNNQKLPLIAINDIISKYINKTDMNKSDKLKLISKEIEQYIQEKIKSL